MVSHTRIGNLSPAMGAMNQVGIGWSYRPTSLCSLATQFQTRFLELIPRPIAGHKFPTLWYEEQPNVSARQLDFCYIFI